jgi:hypothetical protein
MPTTSNNAPVRNSMIVLTSIGTSSMLSSNTIIVTGKTEEKDSLVFSFNLAFNPLRCFFICWCFSFAFALCFFIPKLSSSPVSAVLPLIRWFCHRTQKSCKLPNSVSYLIKKIPAFLAVKFKILSNSYHLFCNPYIFCRIFFSQFHQKLSNIPE